MLKILVGKEIDEFGFLIEHWGCKNNQLSYHFYIVCISCPNEQADIWFTWFLLFYVSQIK